PALAATFNADRAKEMGVALGLETRSSGFQQIAGPGMNMYRTPYSGRSFEYVSGEDPYLGAVMAAAEINGIQSQGVWADAKHYIANEQEAN
ncbi:glycoside hydrolase family 3 N-terminal domain-containing protein, partial [Priestia sp. SIMBA_032]